MQSMRVSIVLALLLAAPLRAEIVDRIVAVVNGKVITWSGVLEEANYRAFRNGQEPVAVLDGEALKTVVSHLADQELLENEKISSPFSALEDDRPQRIVEETRKRFPDPGDFEKELRRFQLTESEFLRRLNQESAILAFIDYHLRPQAHVGPGAVETYYREILLPELRQQGASSTPALQQVSSEIERILTEQEMNRLLDEWLRELRGRAKIRILQ